MNPYRLVRYALWAILYFACLGGTAYLWYLGLAVDPAWIISASALSTVFVGLPLLLLAIRAAEMYADAEDRWDLHHSDMD